MTVRVVAQEFDRTAIQVLDNGIGVPETIRDRILEPFVTTRADGTGLGLAIASDVVRWHRGENCCPRKFGTCMKIVLPQKTKRTAATFWCRAMTSRVYVIDDDERFRKSLCALIESVGLKVDGWSNPEAAEQDEPRAPGCVVLDYRLPSLSGLEVLRLLRRMKSIPAILISAYADVQTVVAAMQMGATTVFEKPIDDNAFLNALERFCFEDAQRLLKRRLCIAVQQDIAKLSEIERLTLEQMRLGLSNKAVARKLGKSVKAIERHRQSMARNRLRFGHGSAAEGSGLPAAHLLSADLRQGRLSEGRYIRVK